MFVECFPSSHHYITYRGILSALVGRIEWLGSVEAADERDAIEIAAEKIQDGPKETTRGKSAASSILITWPRSLLRKHHQAGGVRHRLDTYPVADTAGMAKKPEPPKPVIWNIFKIRRQDRLPWRHRGP
jgi:hypothetical protein